MRIRSISRARHPLIRVRRRFDPARSAARACATSRRARRMDSSITPMAQAPTSHGSIAVTLARMMVAASTTPSPPASPGDRGIPIEA